MTAIKVWPLCERCGREVYEKSVFGLGGFSYRWCPVERGAPVACPKTAETPHPEPCHPQETMATR